MTRKESFRSEHTIDAQTERSLVEKSFRVDTPPTQNDTGRVTVTVAANQPGDFYVVASVDGETVEDIPFSFAEGDTLELPIQFDVPAADADYTLVVSGGVVT